MRVAFLTSFKSEDDFVGIRFFEEEDSVNVFFPHGYRISENEIEKRKDVISLLTAIKKFSEKKEGEVVESSEKNLENLPLSSYRYLIYDYLQNGYYIEKEHSVSQNTKGKILWKQTIKQEKPIIDRDDVTYLRFRTSIYKTDDSNLLTKIHKICVYQAFYRFGWLFLEKPFIPAKPEFSLNASMCVSLLRKAIGNTFNDKKRKLFQTMIDILNDSSNAASCRNVSIGVNKFESIWENIVDYIYGCDDKEMYNPHAKWISIDKDFKGVLNMHPLRLDTVMKTFDPEYKMFVLDAKYYKAGIGGSFPGASDIQKQLAYSKSAYEMDKYILEKQNVFNAFVIPFCSNDDNYLKPVCIGKISSENYSDQLNRKYVVAVLADTKTLINSFIKKDGKRIKDMADCIETALISYKESMNN